MATRSGVRVDHARPFKFLRNGDEYGWRTSATDGTHSYTLFIQASGGWGLGVSMGMPLPAGVWRGLALPPPPGLRVWTPRLIWHPPPPML